MRLFTIGYGELGPSVLVSALKERSVQFVVDIRIWPIRASMGSYVVSKSPDKGIQGLLGREGIAYFSFLELGNPYRELSDWTERYRRLIGAAGDLLTERLNDVPGPLCLFCSEKDPKECHRLILAELLEQCGTRCNTSLLKEWSGSRRHPSLRTPIAEREPSRNGQLADSWTGVRVR
jgi:uncharacterized protein (DUF488 family)